MASLYPHEQYPECVTCGGPINFDNNDGEVRGGMTHFYLGSSEATKCKPCGEWFHHNCGNEKHEICQPCIQYCLQNKIDWRAA